MRISVCLCTYNGEKYIKEQIDTLLMQSMPVNEIIVRDDCSKDSTINIINEYVKRYPNISWDVSVNQKNLGWRENFKNCIEACTGDIIFLCDQDDLWELDKIEIMTKALTENEKAELLLSDFRLLEEEGASLEKHLTDNANTKKISKIKADKKLIYPLRPGCTYAFKKSLKEEFLRNWEPTLAHDYLLSIISILKGTAYKISYESITFRRHANNASADYHKKISKEEREVAYKAVNFNLLCCEKLGEMKLKDKEKKLLNKIYKWLKKRKSLYDKPNIFKFIGLFRYVRYYRSLKGYVKDINAIIYK